MMNSSVSAAPLMLREADTGPVAWTADSLDADAGLVVVSKACRAEMLALAALLEANPLPLVALKPDDFELPEIRDLAARAKEILETGVGFVMIDRLPVDELDPDHATALYWLIANMIGRTAAQKWDGLMAYDVRDTGQTRQAGNGVRSSITSEGQGYHTDNSFNLPPDYVALFCLQSAKEGGVNGVVSFQTAHNKLLERDPDLLARLYEPFYFDRQREHASDDPELVNRWPIFSYDGDKLYARYADILVYAGYEMAGEALDDRGRRAIQALDAAINEPGMRREFDFEPGQIQILDNRRLGHRRTAFTDWPEPERRRHLVRVWIRNSGRPFYAG